MSKKKKVLLFIKVPPPTTGATLMNTFVRDSELIKRTFLVRTIPISYMKRRRDMGKINFYKLKVFLKILIELFKELLKNKPDLVYFQLSHKGIAFYRDVVFITIMKLFNVKIVFHLHGKGIKENSKNHINKILYKYSFKDNFIISLSDLLKNDFSDVYIGRPFFVPNGIPITSFLSKKQYFLGGSINLLFLSNLKKNKGILKFIEILELLKEKNIDFNAKIIGAEADYTSSQLNEVIIKKNLSNQCIYLGAKYNKEKEDILKSTDLLIYPTSEDAFPLVILEAFQCQIPVIAANEGAISEMIDNSLNGFVIDDNSIQTYVDIVEELVANYRRIKELSIEAGKKFNREYTIQIFETNINYVFKKILNS